MTLCPCGSGEAFDNCCAPILDQSQQAASPEALMRARYTAFTRQDIEFIGNSLHPDHRHDHDEAATRRWAENANWLGLEIVSTDRGAAEDEAGQVEFIATFKEGGMVRKHHERSQFKRHEGQWYFTDGEMVLPETQVNSTPKVGRNEPCPCGSGKKHKKCCGAA